MLTIIRRNRQEIENAGGLYVYRLILAAVIAFYAVILAAVVLLAATTAEAAETRKNATRTEAKEAAGRKEDRKNEKVVREYIRRKYGKRYKADIRNADNITAKDIRTRKGKKKVLVERLETISRGKQGRTEDGFIINYARPERKGKHVSVYLIYSPRNNSIDGVTALVSGGKIAE